MKKFSTRMYIIAIALFVVIFVSFAFAYILISDRYISNTASESILRMDKQVGLTVDQKVSRDFTRFQELVEDIETTNTDIEDKYNAFVARKNEFVIKDIEYKIGYAYDQGYFVDNSKHPYTYGAGETEYYKMKVAIYRFTEILDTSNEDKTNYIVFRYHDLLAYFDVEEYLYETIGEVDGMPENYFLIVENNCGIAYQENNKLYETSLVNSHIATQESNDLAEEMYKREGGYTVLLFDGKNSLLIFAPILNDLSDNNLNLVYVVDQKVALNTVSYLRTYLLVVFVTVFILINIAILICVIIYTRKEQDLRNNRLRYFFSKPFIIGINKKGRIKEVNRTFSDKVQAYRKYKTIYDFKFYDLDEEVMKVIRLQKTITIEAKNKDDNKIYIRLLPLKTFGGYKLIGEDITVSLYEQIKNSQIALYNNVTHLPNKYIGYYHRMIYHNIFLNH